MCRHCIAQYDAISGCCYADILTIPTGFNKISSVSLIIVTKKEEFRQDRLLMIYVDIVHTY